jgi:7-cyano-7-deazaguanine tRNA-ribosyltransferase
MIKFNIHAESSNSNARSGTFEINNKKIETPFLWIGSFLLQKPKPWEFFPMKGVFLNAYELIEKNREDNFFQNGETLQSMIGTDKIFLMDSGGFQLLKKDIKLDPEKVLDIYHKAKPDIGVVLDFPLHPSSLDKRKQRWKKTLKNTEFMIQNSRDIALMPVIHGYSIKEIKKACQEVKKISDPQIIGMGSIVPILRSLKSSNLPKLNDNSNSFKLLIKMISTVREEFPDSFLHAFGVGSASTMHLMFALGVDSVDSMSWRMKAAYGAIQLPGLSDRFIISKNRQKGRIPLTEFSLLDHCKCPICQKCGSLEEKISMYSNLNENTFKKRAIHNAFTLKEEEKIFKKYVKKDDVLHFFQSRSKKNKSYSNFNKYLNNDN